jgi:hypothetical protein
MLAWLVFCESVDAWDPQLWSLALYTLSTGAIGMLLARRRPILSAPFIFFVLLSASAVYLELRDSYFGPSILRVAVYILGSTVAVSAGIGMSLLGALVGANKVDGRREAWRWTLGGSGADQLARRFVRRFHGVRSNGTISSRRILVAFRLPGCNRLNYSSSLFRTRLGAPVAIKAMAAKLARLVYRMLCYGMKYVDKGAALYQAQHRQLQIKQITRKAISLGYQLIPIPAA